MLWMSLGNISERGKEMVQRIVLKCLQSLHRKAPQGVGMVTLSRPGTSCWKHLWGAEAQAFCLPRNAGSQGQEGSPLTALRVAVPGQLCGSGHVPADTTMTPPGLRPPLREHCLWLRPHRLILLSPRRQRDARSSRPCKHHSPLRR